MTELGYPIALVDLFRFTTIEKLARFLQQDFGRQQFSETLQRSVKMRSALNRFQSVQRGRLREC